MKKNFAFQNDEKFCIFVTKEKRQTNNVLYLVFTGFDSKSSLEFLILDCNV